MKKALRLIIAFVGMISLLTALSLTVFDITVTDHRVYDRLQTRLNLYGAVGMDEGDVKMVMADVGAYLKGKITALDRIVTIDGIARPVFGDRELVHMEDVLALFLLLRRVVRCASAMAVICIFALIVTVRSACARTLANGLIAALSTLVLFIAAVAVWAAIDFRSLFTQFHHLLFSNDLWLLDPATDVMIRMMPQEFFVGIAQISAVRIAALFPVSIVCSMVLKAINKKVSGM